MRNLSGSEKYNQPYYYTYDDNGNLLSIGDGTYTTTYEYDESNQLIRENNQKGGFTYIWGYGDSGNIEFRREYAYTTAPIVVSENGGTLYNYKFTNSGWKDQLTAINSDSYTYDAIGNMLTGGGRTYTWKHGRQLATLTQGGTTWTSTYNADGLRTQRTDGTNTYKYYYSDGKLICMYRNSTRSFFAYTPDGLPYYMTYGGKYYVYALNLQGDVMAILDDTGKSVVEYTYDAWGNVLSITGSMKDTVGQFNPLRYRGYVYDNETELYYLQSRYYDPEIGRFISADGQISAPGGEVLGNNMYAYCFNNPVNLSDPNGNWPRWITAAVCVVAATVTVAAAMTGNFVVAAAAAKVSIAAGAAYIAQSVHYDDRASKNKGMDEMTYEEAVDIPGADPNVSDTFHDFSGDNNKVCLEDGREGIYDSSGKYVDDPRDIGTYNYFVPKDFWSGAGHVVVDVVPYFIFGNNDNDPGPIINFAEKWANNLITLFE